MDSYCFSMNYKETNKQTNSLGYTIKKKGKYSVTQITWRWVGTSRGDIKAKGLWCQEATVRSPLRSHSTQNSSSCNIHTGRGSGRGGLHHATPGSFGKQFGNWWHRLPAPVTPGRRDQDRGAPFESREEHDMTSSLKKKAEKWKWFSRSCCTVFLVRGQLLFICLHACLCVWLHFFVRVYLSAR
jgi:hypothetical protein